MKPVHLTRMIALAGLMGHPSSLPAQTFNLLHVFTADNALSTNLDGAYPEGGLLLSDGVFYGTASAGGTNKEGTIFSMNTDGSDYTVLHTFAAGALTSTPVFTNADGSKPQGNLVLAFGALYGTAGSGGTNGNGTIFSLNTNGSGFTVLHTFAAGDLSNADGFGPNSLVLSSDGILYGTANGGGANDYGTIFSIQTNGDNFAVLRALSADDGENPGGSLLLWSNTLYGTAKAGGDHTYGTVYSKDTSDTGFAVLHSFSAILGDGTNSDGTFPVGGLLLSGGTLYGTASGGGTNGNGTVFAVSTNGMVFKTLYSFPAGFSLTNLTGSSPEGRLTLADDTLYGTATDEGANNSGTLFCLCTNGTAFKVLYAFTRLDLATNRDGAHPETGLLLSGGTLFGTAQFGGDAYGTVFSLAIVPGIASFALAGTNVVFQGTNAVAGENCSVLASGDLTRPLNQWTPVAAGPLSTNGGFTITATNAVNPALNRQFYFLKVQ
jgi:uncharacterized repeat protein (TIGR03803 family)